MDQIQSTIFSVLTPEALKVLIEQSCEKAIQKHINSTSLSHKEDKTEEELITRQQAAKLWGISLVTLDTWKKSGVIKAYRIGALVRFKKQEVIDALKAMKTGK